MDLDADAKVSLRTEEYWGRANLVGLYLPVLNSSRRTAAERACGCGRGT